MSTMAMSCPICAQIVAADAPYSANAASSLGENQQGAMTQHMQQEHGGLIE